MKILDLCSGTGSATQAFRDRGHVVHTLDIEGNHDFICDVLQFSPLWGYYDFIWASPPCTCFSMAAVGHHWNNHIPKPETLEAIKIVNKVINICKRSRYFMIENPMAMLRTIIPEQRRKYYLSTVTYCQYGDTAMKPTDLLHNIDSFHPLRCKNGDKCHVASPRHSHNPGSTQGKKLLNERYKVPYGLSLAVCKAIERDMCVLA